ncbi:MAG TPA: PKD domain-containing protein [Puia sp.]|nr:PKD domain-containing protein [Puia sp.]
MKSSAYLLLPLLSCMFLCTPVSYSQVRAGFSADIVAGCAPQAVQFQDMSSGNPTAWKWDLGNGTVSFFQNPSTVYYIPGTYTIRLVATNFRGADTLIREHYITVYENPKPDFTASDTIGCFPLKIQFTNLTPAPGNAVSQFQWKWDFGDGNISTLPNPGHTYGNAGNFTVTLQVTTDHGCGQTAGKRQYIRIAAGVKAGFTDTRGRNCQAPVQVQFVNGSDGPGTLSYNWDFGDGSSSSLESPAHIYSANGTYTATLIASSSAGCRDTLKKVNLFSIGGEIARFVSPDGICTGLSFGVNNTSYPSPSSVRWDFGDGTLSTAAAPSKTYSSPGIYTIRLVDSFPNCIDSARRPIRVMPRLSASFTARDLYSCHVPFVAHFTSNAALGTVCLWDFGDGGTGTGPNPAHTYTSSGLFTVRLAISGPNGCPDTLTKPDYIHIQPPQIDIQGLPVRGCFPLTITPTALVRVADDSVAYRWDFGDGSGSLLAAPVKTYSAAGDYTVRLVIRTAGGCMDSVVIPAAVLASQKPRVKFTADPLDACRSRAVRFVNLSIPAGDQWAWDFGDGGVSGLSDPVHLYGDTGYFKVSMVVLNKGCADTLSADRSVHISPPVARFTTGFNCTDKYTRLFTENSIGAQSLQWDFGDGATSTEPHPAHHYSQKGIYRVKLVVTHDACVDSSFQNMFIADEHLDFQATETEICKGSPQTFSLSGMNPVYTAGVLWNFGDGVTSSVAGNIAHTYTRAGWYTVLLIFTDVNGCRDSVIRRRYVHVNGPTADFGVQGAVCIKGAVELRDRSVPDSTHTIIQWAWDFGDGTVSTYSSPPFTHVYTSAGRYTIGLKITDANGCMDSLVKRQVILVSNPRAAFAASDSNTCPGKVILFSDSSAGPGLQYEWHFGNGARSTQASPQYVYPSTGIYRVDLLIVDSLGCRDSLSHSIRISVPLAGFDLSDSSGNCPPLQVRFTNRSQNYIALQWDLGDGSVSTLEKPIHFYNFPGIYFVKVLIRGPGGCEDSAIRKIVVKGPQGSFSYSPLTGCRPLTVQLKASIQEKESLIWDFNDGNTNATHDTVVNYTYGLAGDFLPKMILIDSAGCKVAYAGGDTLKVIGVSCLAGMDIGRICDSGYVQFTDRSVANDYIAGQVWDFGDGTTSLLSNPRHYYDSVGVFTVRHLVTTAKGCTDSISWPDTVKVYRSPGVVISGDSAACAPGALSFRAGVTSRDSARLSWKWDFGNGQTADVPDPGVQAYPVPGGYLVQLQVVYANYCSSTASRIINSWPLPNTFAGNDTFVCEGHPVQLRAAGADSYIWSPAPGASPATSCIQCADPWIDPAMDTTYIVTGLSLKGCIKKDSVHVRVRHPFTLNVSPGAAICAGQSTVIVASGAEQYQWIPAMGLSDPNFPVTRASPAQTTVYQVIGRDNDHCFTDSLQVSVIVNLIPQVFAGNDTTVITGSIIPLYAVNSLDVDEWSWAPVIGLSCSDCPDPKVTVKNTITYRVSVANAGGCTSSSAITIHAVCNDNNWFVPNTFSPNGDGMNDVFYVRGKGLNSIRSIRIFNRWGQLVFEKRDFPPNDPPAGWDGTFNGRQAPMDVYVYFIEVICDNSMVIPYRGNVMLIR